MRVKQKHFQTNRNEDPYRKKFHKSSKNYLREIIQSKEKYLKMEGLKCKKKEKERERTRGNEQRKW